jgi:hypothetical protein
MYTVIPQTVIHTSDNNVWYEETTPSWFHDPVIETENNFNKSCPMKENMHF